MPARILLIFFSLLFLPACVTGGGVYHKVLPGQTLYSISRSYAVDERYLARINGIDDPTQLKAGQQLYIPGATRRRNVPATVAAGSPSEARAVPPREAVSRTPVKTGEGSPAAVSPPPVPPSAVVVKGGRHAVPEVVRGKFIWPVQGKLLKRFGSNSHGALCKGLEISAVAGAPVVSAAAGKVIYSGDGINGFGNLIIVRHDDSFFTVYGFNQKNLVPSGAFVSKGQQIARAGIPPKGGGARLYFEIRYGKKPVDPIFYLP